MGELQVLLSNFGPALVIVVLILLFVVGSNFVARRSQQGTAGLLYQLLNWAVVSIAVLVIVAVLPISSETRGQVISLLGLVFTAVIALSSTTFVANAMAGVMLHITRPFRPGDYLSVNNQFGRVTKRSLIHTQIQTEWRDITTLPNMLLVNNPVTVMHRDGTIISAEVSIGYDIAYTTVQKLLLLAGKEAGLDEPYVLVQELLDHAVVYRICGFLKEMKYPLSARSNLRKKVLEELHGHGIEIVSPSFMNQRVLDPLVPVIPEIPVAKSVSPPAEAGLAPEEKIFDKAEEAASLEELRQAQKEILEAIKQVKSQMKGLPDESRDVLNGKLARLKQRNERLEELIDNAIKGEG